MPVHRRTLLLALVGLGACGGGGGGSPLTTPGGGTTQSTSIASRSTATTYPLSIYWPPGDPALRPTLPVVYLLDGEARFQTAVDAVERIGAHVIVIGVGNDNWRNRDDVPPNTCTPGGGGEAAFLDFLRLELVPYVEANVGGDAQQRILLGHSHGGSFVFYALFAEATAAHTFHAYLPADASIECMPQTVYGWEAAYAAANAALPVRLYISYADNTGNAAFGAQVLSRGYAGLAMAVQPFGGGHIGMLPAAIADSVAFALAN
jgi:hypothetical protein